MGDGSLGPALWLQSREEGGVGCGSKRRRRLVSGCEGKSLFICSRLGSQHDLRPGEFGLPRAQLCPDACEEFKGSGLVEACLFVASLTPPAVAPGAAPGWLGLGGSEGGGSLSQNRGSWGCREEQEVCWALKRTLH